MNNTIPESRNIRTDIQVLRGFAVLIVLFYHAKTGLFSGGYLGVDVFFVISGFLITRLIRDKIEHGSFSFSNFYFRRARRLLPAAYVTFLATALLAPFILTSSGLEDFRAQLVGAITFTSNIVLWRQSGYFEGAAELKPLLHVWSLSIEEQFYFLLPAALVIVPRRYWLKGAIAIFLASLVLCFAMMQVKPAATFYLLPTRAWELSIGSIGALMICSERLKFILKLVFWPALVLLVVLPFAQIGSYHPGPDALLICIATLVILLRQHPLLFNGLVMKGFSRAGDISYSLYLVHWPLFAFFNNIWVGEPTSESAYVVRLGLVVLSLLLAYLLNRYVEEPFRRMDIKATKPFLAYTAASSLGLLLIAVVIPYAFKGDKDYAFITRVNHGLSDVCEFTAAFQPVPECRNSDRPEILIWGDSFAMHLVPGIIDGGETAPYVVQATRSVCGPLLGVARVNDQAGYSQTWAENCIDFNESVINYIKETKSINTVVLSSPFDYFLNNNNLLIRDSADGSHRLVGASQEVALERIKKTIDTVRKMGRRIVVIAPPPANGLDNSRCQERLERKLLSMGGSDCSIGMREYHKSRADVLEFLASLPSGAGVEVISFDSYLCSSGSCKTQINGVSIYRDAGHLSYTGSVALARSMSLIEKIQQFAK